MKYFLFCLLITTFIIYSNGLQQELASLSIQLEQLKNMLPSPRLKSPLTISKLKQFLELIKKERREKNIKVALVEKDEFLQTAREFSETMKKMHSNNLWVDGKRMPEDIYKERFSMHKQEYPYAQKLIVPSGSFVYFWGDMHGSAFSLMDDLENMKKSNVLNDSFKIIKDNIYMVFLGDYVDRGKFGVETLYMLFRLKIENPDKVFLLKGNHENWGQNQIGGFEFEFELKYNDDQPIEVYNIHTLLPLVLYLGTKESGDIINYIQCCHGGIEIGYLPHNLLKIDSNIAFEKIERLNRKTNFDILIKKMEDSELDAGYNVQNLKKYLEAFNTIKDEYSFIQKEYEDFNVDSSSHIGFNWSDFIAKDDSNVPYPVIPELEKNKDEVIKFRNEYLAFNEGRMAGFIYGNIITKNILEFSSIDKHKIRSIFRAHQHNHTMQQLWDTKGLFKLWKGLVITFLSAPYSGLHFPYDSFGILMLRTKYNDWALTHMYKDVNDLRFISEVLSLI